MLTFNKVEKTKPSSFLLSFCCIKHNWKTILCMQMLYKPNDCCAYEDYSYFFWASGELWLVSYGHETVSRKDLRTRSRLLGLLFTYPGHGTYVQATPRLLNNWQWVVSRSSTLLALKTNFSGMEDVDTFWAFSVWQMVPIFGGEYSCD